MLPAANLTLPPTSASWQCQHYPLGGEGLTRALPRLRPLLDICRRAWKRHRVTVPWDKLGRHQTGGCSQKSFSGRRRLGGCRGKFGSCRLVEVDGSGGSTASALWEGSESGRLRRGEASFGWGSSLDWMALQSMFWALLPISSCSRVSPIFVVAAALLWACIILSSFVCSTKWIMYVFEATLLIKRRIGKKKEVCM